MSEALKFRTSKKVRLLTVVAVMAISFVSPVFLVDVLYGAVLGLLFYTFYMYFFKRNERSN